MLRSFNCGLGMVLIVQKNNTQQVLKMLVERGENPSIVGEVVQAFPGNFNSIILIKSWH